MYSNSKKMRFIIIILCLTFFFNVKCYESDEEITDVYEDAENDSDDEDYEYEEFKDVYDESKFFKKIEKLNETEIVAQPRTAWFNCFGLNGKFSNLMENFLINDANGTKALKVVFYSRSRSQPRRVLVQCGESFSLVGTDFDMRKRTVFIVHGFLSSGDQQWITDMEEALLLWGDLNVFVVDWSAGSNTWNYFKAAVNIKSVGDQIATFINQIINDVSELNYADPNKWGPLHLIGHSLGAHICGYASYQLKLRGDQWPVFRITGLDPAQPCFRNSDPSLRLDRSDAEFVDIIHTNGKILIQLGLGLPYPLGHIDFYPNGGRMQPGCIVTESSFWKYLPLPIEKIKKTICSHGRSHLYFTESIYTAVKKNCTFWAQEWDMSYNGLKRLLSSQCDVPNKYHKCIEMGINAERYIHNGTFFVVTGGSSPYCSVSKQSIDEVMRNCRSLRLLESHSNETTAT